MWRKMILLPLTTLLVTIGLSKCSDPDGICTTPSCLAAASHLVQHLDTTIDPCDDFFKFVCGKALKPPHIHKPNITPTDALQEKIQRQILEIVQEPIKPEDHDLIKLEKELFRSCMNESTLENESLDRFKETLKELNGWPVATGFTWKGRLFDWARMIYELRKRGYRYWMMLHVDVANDPSDLKDLIPLIEFPNIREIKEEHKELYFNYMVDVAVAFGAERRSAGTEMEKVLDFREKLRNISVTSKKSKFARLTMEEFQQRNGELDWAEFINNILYPIEGISNSDFVIVPEKAIITAYFHLLWKTQRRVQANFIIWSILEGIIPLLSKELKQIKSQYDCLTDTATPRWDHYEFCGRLLTESFCPLPSLIPYARRYLPPTKRIAVQGLFARVKREFAMLLSEASWMDQGSKGRAMEKLGALDEIIGAQGDYFDNAVFDKFYFSEYYENVNDISFLDLLLITRKVSKNLWLARLHNSTTRLEFYSIQTLPGYLAAGVPYYNSIIFPVGMLEETFHVDQPMYLNYGAAGFVMGRELTEFFIKRGNFFDKDGDMNNIWSNSTEKAYEEEATCVAKDELRYIPEEVETPLRREPIIADITGAKTAYLAYRKWVRENGEEPKLPGLGYTPYQLFWITIMSQKCLNLKEEQLVDTPEQNRLNAFQTAAPMRNNVNFAKHFDCPQQTRMNPRDRCQLL